MSGKGTCNFLKGELAVCFVFSARDTEVDVRTSWGITEEDKGVPVDLDKGIGVRKIIAGESENDLLERRSRTLDESGDCMNCRVEDGVVVDYLLVGSVFFLNGPDHGRYGEVFQMGKNREGVREFDVVVVGGQGEYTVEKYMN